LARDAGRLQAKCGSNCSVAELSEWRERVLAQLKTVLEEERRSFVALSGQEDDQLAELPSAALGNAA